MKNFAVLFVFTPDYKKILLVKRRKPPYLNCWNGVGGKIERGETNLEAAHRECMEETGLHIPDLKLLMTCVYPPNEGLNNDISLHITYGIHEEVDLPENEEGSYAWKEISFARNCENRELAGFANIAQIVKEILDREDIEKFYL